MTTEALDAALDRAMRAFGEFSEALRSVNARDAQFVRRVAEALCARQGGGCVPRMPAAALPPSSALAKHVHDGLLALSSALAAEAAQRRSDARLARRLERAIAATESETSDDEP